MAVTPEQRMAKALKAFNDQGGGADVAAYLFVQNAEVGEMARAFDLLLGVVRQLASLDMTETTPQKSDLVRKAKAIRRVFIANGFQ